MTGFRRRRLTDFEEDLARTPKSQEDESILSIAEELSRKLGLKSAPIYLDWVAWRDRGGSGFSLAFMAADMIMWGRSWLTLPKRMKGLLEPEEWRPLLASSLIYDHDLRKKLVSQEMIKAGIPGVLVGIPFYLYIGIPRILNAFASNSLTQMGLWSVLFFAPVVMVSLLGSWVEKGLRLRADRQAADLVGGEEFLGSLRKMKSMQFRELERWRPDFPKLSKRLGNITKYSPRAIT